MLAMSERPAHLDHAADAAYFPIEPRLANGSAAEQVVIDRPHGTIVLDFDDAGHLLGVEVLGATELLTDAARARLTDIADIV